MSGYTMRVLPGFQRLNGEQREALLKLGEAGELESPVRVRKVGGRVLAVDRRGRSWTIFYDGLTMPTPPR
jgi:hypothetical protein